MEKLIMNSYKKSGYDSCKLLLMTATPFTNSPLELFSLLNLFMTSENDKITTDKEEFKKLYMTPENILSQNGSKIIANKFSAYISYLNREKDPTQFAQPIMINIPVLMTNVDEKFRNPIFLNTNSSQINKTDKPRVREIKKSLIQEYMLYKNCPNIKYKSFIKPKSHKKAKTLSIKLSKNKFSTRKIKSI